MTSSIVSQQAEERRKILEAQIETISQKARGVVQWLVSDIHLVEDIVQEALMKAWNRIENYNPLKATLDTWVTRIAVNQARDYLRKSRRNGEIVFTDFEKKVGLPSRIKDATFVDPALELEYKERTTEIRSSITQLPELLREAIQLYHFYGFGYSKIAETLGVPIGTVKSRIYSARKQLRPTLSLLVSH
jgi:RNA polymerase sigma-70 factor (ECF subfamily)